MPSTDNFQWNDDKVIDFVNWYLQVKNLDFRYSLENMNLIDSFKKGDDPNKWTINNVTMKKWDLLKIEINKF